MNRPSISASPASLRRASSPTTNRTDVVQTIGNQNDLSSSGSSVSSVSDPDPPSERPVIPASPAALRQKMRPVGSSVSPTQWGNVTQQIRSRSKSDDSSSTGSSVGTPNSIDDIAKNVKTSEINAFQKYLEQQPIQSTGGSKVSTLTKQIDTFFENNRAPNNFKTPKPSFSSTATLVDSPAPSFTDLLDQSQVVVPKSTPPSALDLFSTPAEQESSALKAKSVSMPNLSGPEPPVERASFFNSRPASAPSRTPEPDKRYVVDYLCKSEDLIPLNGQGGCRVQVLTEIASGLGISESEIQGAGDRAELCDLVNRKIVELDITANLAECKKNIALIEKRNLESGDPSIISAEFKQLMQWYADVESQAANFIKSKQLNKMVEIRNQIKGSCDTFNQALLARIKEGKSAPAPKPKLGPKSKSSSSFFSRFNQGIKTD